MRNTGKILAVDDTPASLRLLTDILKDEGYEVRAAISGELALRAAILNPPELVLLDIRMPGIDGIEILGRLRKMDGELPVIMITGFGSIQDAVQTVRSGAYDYLTKPFSLVDLEARARALLRRAPLILRSRLRDSPRRSFRTRIREARPHSRASVHVPFACAPYGACPL